MIIKHYADSDAIAAALLDSTLDVAVGDKVLKPQQVQEFQRKHAVTHSFVDGPPLLNQIVVMNAAKAPTDDLEVRKLIMHSIDKARIVADELYGQAQVADSMFPKDAPYCDIELTPRWAYDLQKAQLMNCQPTPEGAQAAAAEDDLPLILGLTLGIGIPVLLASGAVCFFIGRTRGYADMEKEAKEKKKRELNSPVMMGISEKPENEKPENAA